MTNKKDTDKKATSKVDKKVSKKLKVFKSPSAFSVFVYYNRNYGGINLVDSVRAI